MMRGAPPPPNHPSHTHKGKGLLMQGDGRAAKSGNALRRPLHVNIHFLAALTKKKKKKAARINMHEGLKEADAGRVTTPGLSRCMLIKHSSA